MYTLNTNNIIMPRSTYIVSIYLYIGKTRVNIYNVKTENYKRKHEGREHEKNT